jgi:hypothetical protein
MGEIMHQTADPVTVSVPRTLLSGVVELSRELSDRMHELLERNTDGQLGAMEKSELETLVRMAEFGEILSAIFQPPRVP